LRNHGEVYQTAVILGLDPRIQKRSALASVEGLDPRVKPEDDGEKRNHDEA
jgi:hypothetical protein